MAAKDKITPKIYNELKKRVFAFEKNNHKVFNADEEYFQGVSSIEVGTHVYTENGIVTLVDKEYIEEDVEYYNIITTTHFNVFANGVLTGNRYDNR